MTGYRHLVNKEIALLLQNGCVADNWYNVMVSDNFDPRQLLRVHFSGLVKLGTGVRISDSCISDYIVGDNTVISDVSCIFMDGKSSFGIGYPISCLNEAGGREVRLHRELSSQIAYLEAMYRHRPGLTAILEKLHEESVNGAMSGYGIIGSNVSIRNVGTIRSAIIGDNTVLEDCIRLENGTVTDGSTGSGAYIGAGVICRNFVVRDGAEVSDGVNIDGVFVGQGTKLSKGFSAVASLFFANSHCENGEAVAVFAGPNTVSHHKSTLLIGGMYSYMNAGSNTNFSNHLYKLGPLHHGIFERGVKFGSGSYMCLPARIGAYSIVLGHHKAHFDSSDLPFSYLFDKGGLTYIVPGVNLFGCGLFRDVEKWKKRDRRKSVRKCLDIVNNEAFTPYTASKMLRGVKKLRNALQQNSSAELYFDGFRILPSVAEKGIVRYEKALLYYIGIRLCTRLKSYNLDSDDTLRAAFMPECEIGGGEWVDVGGMIVPVATINCLLDEFENGKTGGFAELSDKLALEERHYSKYEWRWIYDNFEEIAGVDPQQIGMQQVKDFIQRWEQVAYDVCDTILADASKEFSEGVMYGFGIDGCNNEAISDFLSVRGSLENTELFMRVNALRADIKSLANNIRLSF